MYIIQVSGARKNILNNTFFRRKENYIEYYFLQNNKTLVFCPRTCENQQEERLEKLLI